VPWFYLKWVLKRSLAHIGYTPVGEFMDDERTHELQLANNTTYLADISGIWGNVTEEVRDSMGIGKKLITESEIEVIGSISGV
jgi:hypothetical protein